MKNFFHTVETAPPAGNDYLRIARWAPQTLSEGPFRRFAIWVQGCQIACPGCCNPEMQDPNKGHMVNVLDLVHHIQHTEGIEGITVLGGEPFDQAAALGELLKRVKALDLGVILFSGYNKEDLLKDETSKDVLSEGVDLLIDGPYQASQKSVNRRYIGSDNQRVWFLSDRYRDCKDFKTPGNSIHFVFNADEVCVTGFPDFFPK